MTVLIRQYKNKAGHPLDFVTYPNHPKPKKFTMSSEKKMIALKSNDGETFEIEEVVALQSETIKHMVGDGSTDNAILLPEVDGATLGKVLEYCNRHVNKDKEADALKAWDKDYVKVDPKQLFQTTREIGKNEKFHYDNPKFLGKSTCM